MTEAWIIDACRTPRGIGKVGKGALAEIHPQQVGVDRAQGAGRAQRASTRPMSTTSSGARSSQVGTQGGDLGRMSALDAGYDIRSSGVTLDRFCGSGITAVNFAAATIMCGMEDLVVAGGTEMMSMPNRAAATSRRSSIAAICTCARSIRRPTRASAPTPSPPWKASTARTLDELALTASSAPPIAIAKGHFDKSLVPVYHDDGTLALDREEFPRPQTTLEGLAALKPSFEALADIAVDDRGHDLPQSDPAEVSRTSTSSSSTTPAIPRAWSTARRRCCWPRPTTPRRTG